MGLGLDPGSGKDAAFLSKSISRSYILLHPPNSEQLNEGFFSKYNPVCLQSQQAKWMEV